MTVKELFGGADMRSLALLNALEETIIERGGGLPIPTILGTLELCKDLVKDMAIK